MTVIFEDPSSLFVFPREEAFLEVFIPNQGILEGYTFVLNQDNKEASLRSAMRIAKNLSKEQFSLNPDNSTGVFVLQTVIQLRGEETSPTSGLGSELKQSCGKKRTLPIVEYVNGELEEYSRPPWRKGSRLG